MTRLVFSRSKSGYNSSALKTVLSLPYTFSVFPFAWRKSALATRSVCKGPQEAEANASEFQEWEKNMRYNLSSTCHCMCMSLHAWHTCVMSHSANIYAKIMCMFASLVAKKARGSIIWSMTQEQLQEQLHNLERTLKVYSKASSSGPAIKDSRDLQ